jgi:hypothetical protein
MRRQRLAGSLGDYGDEMAQVTTGGFGRRLAGRRLHFDGREWTVLYTDPAERVILTATDLDPVLQALRSGAIVLQTDAKTIAAQPAPSERDGAVREWLLLDATIAGARAHDALPGQELDLLERRRAQLTEYLSGIEQEHEVEV